MTKTKVHIQESWKPLLNDFFQSNDFQSLSKNLKEEIKMGKIIYPPSHLIFHAFHLCPFHKLKVVLIGQDPYHNQGEAMGLSFSVPKGIKIPPSLKNIYKELENDVPFHLPDHGDLTHWAKQGVLLLNAMLTVEHKKAGSHQKIGWQNFTDHVIQKISDEKQHIVFLLWGNFAKSKAHLIDQNKHLILQAAHPSPLARGAFFGSKHFSKTNAYLKKMGKTPIDWQI